MTCHDCLFGIRRRDSSYYRCNHPATHEPTALITGRAKGGAAIDRVRPTFTTTQRWPFTISPSAVMSCDGFHSLKDALKAARVKELMT